MLHFQKGLWNICSLTPDWHPKISGTCLNSVIFFFLPIFQNPDIAILSSYTHCQGIYVFGDQRDHVQAQGGLEFFFSSAFTCVNPQLPQPAPEHMNNHVFYAPKGVRQ